MKHILLLLLAGVISAAPGEREGPSENDNILSLSDVLFVDPFMEQRCEEKGIQLKDLDAIKEACIKKAGDEYINSTGGLSDMLDELNVPCLIRAKVEYCIKEFVDLIKKCYDTEAQMKEVENANNVINSFYDFQCKDDAKQVTETFSSFENIFCILGMVGASKECKAEIVEGLNATSVAVLNQETCFAAYDVAVCMLAPMEDCSSREPYNFFSGAMDAAINASKCSEYKIPRLSFADVTASEK